MKLRRLSVLAGLACLLAVGSVFAACGAASGDACDDGSDCGANLVCFKGAGSDNPGTCNEIPTGCEDDVCGCAALQDECNGDYVCVGIADETTFTCNVTTQ